MIEKEKLMVVDDDLFVCQTLAAFLHEDGYQVITAQTGLEALRLLYAEKPGLVLLDVSMPGMDGCEVCRRIRELSDVPIVMVTARGEVRDRVRGLDCGADDYLVKPIAAEELRARVRAHLRRARHSPTEPEKQVLSFDDGRIILDLAAREVSIQGQPVRLRPLEYRLLTYMARNAGLLLSHDQILEAVWGPEYEDALDSLKLYVFRLRQKIEQEREKPRLILTERGLGYRFARPD